MKKTAIIVIAIITAGIGLFVFSVLNRPANTLIRKAFKQISGMAIVNDSEYQAAQATNRELEKQITRLQADRESAYREREAIQADIDRLAADNARMADELSRAKQALAQARQQHEQLTPTEQLTEFDRRTAAAQAPPSTMTDPETASVHAGRIADANWQMIERDSMKEENRILSGTVDRQREQIVRMEAMTSSLASDNQNLTAQLDLRTQQHQNCLKAQEQTLKKANRRAAIGTAAGVLGIALFIITAI